MTVETERFKRKEFYVDAVQVTQDNMHEVAAWCRGQIKNNSTDEKPDWYIDVPVRYVLNDRQKKAFVGDWVLKAGSGFKVYKNRAFLDNFDPENNKPVVTVIDPRLTENIVVNPRIPEWKGPVVFKPYIPESEGFNHA